MGTTYTALSHSLWSYLSEEMNESHPRRDLSWPYLSNERTSGWLREQKTYTSSFRSNHVSSSELHCVDLNFSQKFWEVFGGLKLFRHSKSKTFNDYPLYVVTILKPFTHYLLISFVGNFRTYVTVTSCKNNRLELTNQLHTLGLNRGFIYVKNSVLE